MHTVIQMDEQRLREILREEIRSTLKEVGLADDDAPADIKDLRSLLKNYRAAQTSIIKAAATFFTLGVLGLISAGFWSKFGGGGE